MQNHLNQIHLGDCLHHMSLFPKQSINLILTDPPYLVNYRSRDGRKIAGDITSQWLEPAFMKMYHLLKENHTT